MNTEHFYPGFDIVPLTNPPGFEYGKDCFGPEVEYRKIDDIRPSLLEPDCKGPEIVYAIAMDTGKSKDREILEKRRLLYGAVTYAAGSLGKEPIRSQGHIHTQSVFANRWSTPEVYEIWQGEAIIYMQEFSGDNPGRCFAVYALPGDVIIVPPGWVHATISASPGKSLTFGAWCVREYGFEYGGVRKHGGIAWFPLLDNDWKIKWVRNSQYNHHNESSPLVRQAREYPELKIQKNVPIYTQFEKDNDRFLFVTRPDLFANVWENFFKV